ncbi:MAG TPA: amidase [Microvirga sp.]|nr:amidase [Microvirga sp.]
MSIDPFSAAHELAAQVASRRVSPVELVEAYLARIADHDPKLHAFTEVYAAEARLAAEAAEKAIRSGHSVGPLHGLPVAVKDLVEIAGRTTTGGAAIWRERRSTRTATLVERLIGAGMIVLGKTHTVEFAYGGWGTNRSMGTPWNPWDHDVARVPGGSSSGSGVAVAAGLVPWAVGSDTGGSVRLPASFCGITGLKTTVGRISTYGVLPLSPTLDTPGPMARSVLDAALLYDAMRGPDPRDPKTLACPAGTPLADLRRGVRGLRLARLPENERVEVSPEVLAAYDETIRRLEELGAEVVDVVLPFGFADVAAANGRIMSAESYAHLADFVDDEHLPLDSDVRPRIQAGRHIPSRDYILALQQRSELKAAFDQALANVDALLTPTTRTAAIPLVDVDQSVTPAHFTRLANFLDLCALSLPNGFTAEGLPTSVQIVCGSHDEALALRVGFALQEATDWHKRRPEWLDGGQPGASRL